MKTKLSGYLTLPTRALAALAIQNGGKVTLGREALLNTKEVGFYVDPRTGEVTISAAPKFTERRTRQRKLSFRDRRINGRKKVVGLSTRW